MKKTALVLSGGGSRGAYEVGVWKALREMGISIDIITGTSVGAINGAMIAQGDFTLTEKLWKQLETQMIFDIEESEYSNENGHLPEIGGIPTAEALSYAREIVLNGGAGSSGLQNMLNKFIDEKNVRKSGIEYGLVMTGYPDFNEHFLFLDEIPEGQLTDYIMASASCFPAVQKYVIDEKKYIDGGYRDNMPVEMALIRNATSIIAVDLQAAGIVRKDTVKKAREVCDEFHLIRSPHNLGNFLFFDHNNTSMIMKLGYLDTMKEYKKLDGIKYTFDKGVFTKHQLEGADAAACVLKLDPCTVYSHDSLNLALNTKLGAMVMPGEKTDLMELIESIKKDPSQIRLRPQLLLIIADNLKKDGADSIFLQQHVFKLLEDEVQAANYLINEGLAPFSHDTSPSY
ncbi:MAG: patatin-like phospholipase family protein [Bacillota bacterium]|nr:patatin-like phospholipase family protein [Bacillota bacterium]